MLTPAEELGLAGAALDARVRRAVGHVPESTLAHIARRLAADARLNEVVYDHDGVTDAVPIMLRPLLVMPEQASYLHRVCLRILDALRRIPELWASDPEVRALLPFAPDEEAWVREALPAVQVGINVLYARFDAVCDFTGPRWQDSLQFMEPNLSGVGGILLGPMAQALVMRDVVPVLRAHDPGLAIELPPDQRDLFLQVLMDHARALGRPTRNLCLVEPKYVAEGPNEQSSLAAYCQARHGVTVAHADPRELRLRDGEVWHEDVRVDVAYRDYEVRDLLELERAEGRRLDAMRALFLQNRVVSSIGGEFDHKSCWELLTRDDVAERHFSTSERTLFRRHVLWTRVLAARRTSLPRGEGDLPEYVRRHREELVLKPNRGYGGTGVHIGALVPQREWEHLVDRALREAGDPHGSWVVQQATNIPVQEFAVVDSAGRAHTEPYYAVMGFAPTDNGLATVCRVSQKQVVNVAQRGGLAAVLVGLPPRDLRGPLRSAVPAGQAQTQLREQVRRLRDLDAVIGLLDWDQETGLPRAAHAQRSLQLGTLEGLRHDLLTGDALGDLVDAAAEEREAQLVSPAEIERLRRLRRIAIALPHDLVGAWAEARSRCLTAWEEARRTGSWADYAPSFTTLLALARERGQALTRTGEAWDGLLDEHEPGVTRAALDPLLRQLGERLRGLLDRLDLAREAALGPAFAGHYPDAGQDWFCRALLADIGFDVRRGRVDRATHPFTLMAGGDDVRVTLRVFEDNPAAAIFTTLHEGGHALYDQGFPDALRHTLLADAPGTALHESQARLWENHVGRSAVFWSRYLPRLRELFPGRLDAATATDVQRALTAVRPGTNRVDSDETTYDLHILLRCELEVALLTGDLAADELPGAWSERSRHWLGVEPADLREGCLQDVHWSLGSFGYFPSYTLGNLYAAQLADAYRRDGGRLEEEIAAGAFAPLRTWLARHVYAHGAALTTAEVLRRATGVALDVEPWWRRLAARAAA